MSFFNEIIALSPLVYWRLNDTSGTTAADSSGNAHTGTYTDTFTLNQAATGILFDPSSKSVSLDGSDAYVQGSTNPFTGQRSFFGWFKRTDTSAAHCLFGGGGASAVPMLRMASGGSGVLWFPDDTGTAVTFDNGVGTGAWHFYVLTFDNSTHDAILYIDGAKNGATKNPGQGYGASPGNWKVGARRSTFADTFKGNLNEAGVISGILTAAQVSLLYTAATQSSIITHQRTRRNHMVRR